VPGPTQAGMVSWLASPVARRSLIIESFLN